MEEIRSSEKIRKFYENADVIKGTFKTAIADLSGFYPDNYEYQVGNNPVYINTGESRGGFLNLLILDTNGNLRSGNVYSEDRSYFTKLHFNGAHLELASEAEIIQYGPKLFTELERLVFKEVSQQESPEKISIILGFLKSAPDVHKKIYASSKEVVDVFDGAYTLEQAVSPVHPESVKALEVALDLYLNKQQIIERYNELSEDKDIDKIEEDTVELVHKIDEVGIFPRPAFKANSKIWFPDKSAKLDNTSVVWCSGEDGYYWAISTEGDIRKAYIRNAKDQKNNPVDVIKEAPSIMKFFVENVIHGVYPRIGKEETAS